ncbi:hypothetical protein K1719_038648 [Acacia pycnantha]|nr:hypothetical protein K1719_038648 [Acacia pycnantha]
MRTEAEAPSICILRARVGVGLWLWTLDFGGGPISISFPFLIFPGRIFLVQTSKHLVNVITWCFVLPLLKGEKSRR